MNDEVLAVTLGLKDFCPGTKNTKPEIYSTKLVNELNGMV